MLPNFFLVSEDMKVGKGLLKHAIPQLLGLVFDTRLNVTSLVGHIGCFASRWSVRVFSSVRLSQFYSPSNQLQDLIVTP